MTRMAVLLQEVPLESNLLPVCSSTLPRLMPFMVHDSSPSSNHHKHSLEMEGMEKKKTKNAREGSQEMPSVFISLVES